MVKPILLGFAVLSPTYELCARWLSLRAAASMTYFGFGPRIGTGWPYGDFASRDRLFFSSASRYDFQLLSWLMPRS